MTMEYDELNIESGNTSGLRWSMVRLPKEGETKCGDTHLIKKYRDKALIAAIDGLGHGKSASEASERTKYLLETFNTESIINLVNHCHQKLRSTRGVVMSLALVDAWEKTLTWIGVGNVKGVLLAGENSQESEPESIILRHGIVGYKLPSLQASIVPIAIGDLLIFTTDGVEEDYLEDVDTKSDPKEIVKYIAQNHFKRTDDALILAARFTGEKSDVPTE